MVELSKVSVLVLVHQDSCRTMLPEQHQPSRLVEQYRWRLGNAK